MDEVGTSIHEEATGLKRPADVNSELDNVPPSKIAKTPSSFKNIFRQLSVMRPGLLFDLESEECTDGVNTSYTMVVDVDGTKFTGTGPSKRNAKVLAAEKVLAHLEALGVKPIPESERPPKPAGATQSPIQASTLTEEQKVQQMMGKNPVMMLHEIRPSFDCEIISDERVGTSRKVEMTITVDGQKFTGAGRSNKIARARAAVAALETLFGLEFTDFGENEIPVYLGEEWKWRKFTKKAEKTSPPLTAQGKPMKNAMMQLNDMYKGLEFKVKDRTGPDHCPFFKVSVDIEGQAFEGEGSTKKAAKLDAAEKALVGLSLTGALAQRASQKKQQKWGAQRNWNNSGVQDGEEESYNEGSGDQPDGGGDHIKNESEPSSSFKAVFKRLSLLRSGLKFQLVDEDHNEGGDSLYTVTVDVDDITFTGTGNSKRAAKVHAAEQVVTHLEVLGVKPKIEPKTESELPGQATAPVPIKDDPDRVHQQLVGKNPAALLHEIVPNFHCKVVSEELAGPSRKVTMELQIGGQSFMGTARSNKVAKARAAAVALEDMYGLKFTDMGAEEVPLYLGDDSNWRKLLKKNEKATLSSGLPDTLKAQKNALMALNDMYRGLEYTIVERPVDPSTSKDREGRATFDASVKVEGHIYEGNGTTKKAAKLAAAEKALLGLAISGALAQKNAVKKQEKPAPAKNWGAFRGGFGGANSQNGAGAGGWTPGNRNIAGNKRSHTPWAGDSQGSSGHHGQSTYYIERGRGGIKRGRGQGRGRGGRGYSQAQSSYSNLSQSQPGMPQRGRGGQGGSSLSSNRGNRGGINDRLYGMSSSLTLGSSYTQQNKGSLRGGRGRGNTYQANPSPKSTPLNQTSSLTSPRQPLSSNFSSFEGSYDSSSAWNTQSYSSDYDGSYDNSYNQLYTPRYEPSYSTNYALDYPQEGTDWTSDRYTY